MNNYGMNPLQYAVLWWSHLSPAMAFFTLFGVISFLSLTVSVIRIQERKRMRPFMHDADFREYLRTLNTTKRGK